jgi:hypothetical protein
MLRFRPYAGLCPTVTVDRAVGVVVDVLGDCPVLAERQPRLRTDRLFHNC